MSKELDTYITELNNFADNLDEIVSDIFIDYEESILDKTIKKRLLDTGFDAEGSLIGDGEYSALAIHVKELRGQETGHMTLFHDGGFHDAMFFGKSGKDLVC